MNLANVAVEEIQRGNVVTQVGWLRPTRAVDVRLRVIKAAPKPLEHGDSLTFHTGAAESVARLSLLDTERLEPGQSGWAQLRLAEPVAVARGDQFIVRMPSPSFTVGGGVVVDPHPKRHRRFQDQVVESLGTLEKGTPEEITLQNMPPAGPIEMQSLVQKSGLPAEQVKQAVDALISQGELLLLEGTRGGSSSAPVLNGQSVLISARAWDNLAEKIDSLLTAYHAEYPLRRGMPREEVRSRSGLDARSFSRVESRLLSEGRIVQDGPLMARAGHAVRLTDEQQRRVDETMAMLRKAGASPPSTPELMAQFGLTTELLATLLDQGKLVEIAHEMVLDRQSYDTTVETIVEMIRQQGPITVAAVRDRFNTSRKYALAIMEHLDEKRVTKRVGDERVLY
ncbi:MAG TPA: SelB C-terminal domain-containing protein [Chloroflexota bacterium]|nr:SelB C-terminal domain-containing protein [Chloroflexota bacterium]